MSSFLSGYLCSPGVRAALRWQEGFEEEVISACSDFESNAAICEKYDVIPCYVYDTSCGQIVIEKENKDEPVIWRIDEYH